MDLLSLLLGTMTSDSTLDALSTKNGASSAMTRKLLKLAIPLLLKALGFEHISVDNANPAVIATYPEESSEIIRILADNCSSGNVLALGLESADPAVREANTR